MADTDAVIDSLVNLLSELPVGHRDEAVKAALALVRPHDIKGLVEGGEPETDWRVIAELQPRGYLSLTDTDQRISLNGPIDSVTVNEDGLVTISLKWAATMPINEMGLPAGNPKWTNSDHTEHHFPNHVFPFVVEDTPEKGPRIRFSGTNVIYLEEVEGVNPEEVEGLDLSSL